jgi:hypothetical protein
MTENNFLWYSEPNAEQPCMYCKYRKYDSFHNEMWCNRDPAPSNIGPRLLIDKWGHCEGWEQDET